MRTLYDDGHESEIEEKPGYQPLNAYFQYMINVENQPAGGGFLELPPLMCSDQKSYIDLNSNFHSNIELTGNHKGHQPSFTSQAEIGMSTAKKSAVKFRTLQKTPLNRHITDQKMNGLEVI